MKCGTAEVDITPPVGIDLSGFGARQQPSTGLLDRLYLHALYLEAGDERLLWLHADLIGFEREHVRRARRALAGELGLEKRQILFSATHTHSGPATLHLRQCGAMDPAYMRALDGHVVEAARAACARPVPVTLGFAEGRCHLGCDRRRPSPLSHADPALPVLALRGADGAYIAVIANYAIHNVSLGPHNRLISADMAGAAAGLMRDSLAGAPAVLFTNGGCGNVNPPAESPDPSVMQQFGRRLGQAALYALETGQETQPEPALAAALATVNLPLAVPSAAEVEAEYRRAMDGAAGEELFARNARQAYGEWRAETLALLAGPRAPKTSALDLQVVRIGPVAFACVGAEVFSHLAAGLRAAAGPHTYVVGYANGDAGYLPPRAVYAEGGYEVDMAYKFYGHFMVAEGGFERVQERALAMLRR